MHDQPMAGLRQRKKETRRKEILQAASQLFRKHGYTSTPMDVIASAADISPNTIYNYYRTKGQLLLALISASDESFLANCPTARSQPRNAVEFMVEFLEALAKHSVTEIDKNTWKHAIAQTMVHEGNEDISEDIDVINKKLAMFIENEIRILRNHGYVSSSAKPASLASMLFDFHRILFIRVITAEDMGWKSYRILLRSYVEAALYGKMTKNMS